MLQHIVSHMVGWLLMVRCDSKLLTSSWFSGESQLKSSMARVSKELAEQLETSQAPIVSSDAPSSNPHLTIRHPTKWLAGKWPGRCMQTTSSSVDNRSL